MITDKDIMKISNLAKLEIKDEEVSFYITEVEKLLNFAETINVDENEVNNCRTDALDFKNMRKDVADESFTDSDILSNARETEEGFFKLRKRA